MPFLLITKGGEDEEKRRDTRGRQDDEKKEKELEIMLRGSFQEQGETTDAGGAYTEEFFSDTILYSFISYSL